MKKYKKHILTISVMVLLSACTKGEDKINLKNIQKAHIEINQIINKKADSDFFAPEEYESNEKGKKCIEESSSNFEQLSYCVDNDIKIIKENIKKKLVSLNKPEKILNKEYEKIKLECRKKMAYKDMDPEDDKLEINLLNVSCIQEDLYKYGRNLK